MARRARLRLAGFPWHIVQRGHNRSACFDERADYLFYLGTLEELAPRFDCRLHALVLMTNHVHLLLTPERSDSASLLMKHLGQRYTQFINRRRGRTGTLWESRFHSCIAESGGYVLACYRYIEMNPVRAGMAMGPDEYRWSSHGTNAHGRPWPLISPHADYLRLGLESSERQRAYRMLFETGPDSATVEQIRRATKGNFVLGGADFANAVEHIAGQRARLGHAGRPRK